MRTQWNLIGGGLLAARVWELIQVTRPGDVIKVFDDHENPRAGNRVGKLKSFTPGDLKLPTLLTLGFQHQAIRRELVEMLKFSENICHPDCSSLPSVDMGHGNILLGPVALGHKVQLGTCNLIYTGAILEADVVLDKNILIGPGAIICNEVKIEQGSVVGAGATILPKVRVAAGAVIGAGALVRSDVSSGERIVGVPGRTI